MVTSSMSVASTRPSARRRPRAPPRPPRPAPPPGSPSGSANSARTAAKSGDRPRSRCQSHGGSVGSLRAPSARSGLPLDRPSSHAASSGAGPVTTTAVTLPDLPRAVAVDEPQHRAFRLAAHRLAGVHEQGVDHRPWHVGEHGARVEVDGVDPHLAGPYPRHRRRPDHAALHVGDQRRPGRFRQVTHDGGQPVGRGDDVVADLVRRADRALLDVGDPRLGAGVGGGDDPGARPQQQVDHAVGVAGEVGQHVRAAPSGQQRRRAERVVAEPAHQAAQVRGAVGGPGQRVGDGGRGLPCHRFSARHVLRSSPTPATDVTTMRAVGEVARGLAGVADAARRAGGDDVAGVERDDLRQVDDELDRPEHELVGRGALHGLAVERGADGPAARGQLVGGDQVRAERRGVLERLALQELLGAVLEVAHAHVVHHRVARDRRLRRGRVGVPHRGADHDGELGLPVDLVGDRGQHDVVVRADQRGRELGEDRGVLGQLVAHLQHVVAVVQPHADDLLGGGDERGVVDGVERVRRPGGRLRPRPPVGVGEQRADVRVARLHRRPAPSTPSTRTARWPAAVRIVASLIGSPHVRSRSQSCVTAREFPPGLQRRRTAPARSRCRARRPPA